MAEDMGEKTEQPSSRKLSKAREEGNVAKSMDLSGVTDLIGAIVLVWVFGNMMVSGMGALMRRLLAGEIPDSQKAAESAPQLFMWALGHGLWTSWPVMVIMFAVVALAQVQQVGFMLTLKPLEPKIDKLDPIKGFGKIFGKKGLVKTGLSILKLTFAVTVMWLFVQAHLKEIMGLPMLEASAGLGAIFWLLIKMSAWLLALMLVIGLVDYAYQKWQRLRDLRMTKKEVKDEFKNMEGDPHVKAKRMQVGREMVTQRLKEGVPKASVVVTNPTHFAVALRYEPGQTDAPVVVAKGADYLAFRIRELARQHGVPIVEKPPLARALYATCPVGRPIDSRFYEAVAEVLAFVFRASGKAEEAQRAIGEQEAGEEQRERAAV